MYAAVRQKNVVMGLHTCIIMFNVFLHVIEQSCLVCILPYIHCVSMICGIAIPTSFILVKMMVAYREYLRNEQCIPLAIQQSCIKFIHGVCSASL